MFQNWNLRVKTRLCPKHSWNSFNLSNFKLWNLLLMFCFGHCTMLCLRSMSISLKFVRFRFHGSSGHVAQWCTHLGLLQLPLWQLFVPAAVASSHQCWRGLGQSMSVEEFQVPFSSHSICNMSKHNTTKIQSEISRLAPQHNVCWGGKFLGTRTQLINKSVVEH